MYKRQAQAVRLLVYDTERGLWQEEDVCSYEMAGSGGQLYLWDGKAIWAADADREENWQQAGGIEDGVSFELVSGDIGLDSPEELYLSRLTLRLEAEVKSRIEVAVSYDSGALSLIHISLKDAVENGRKTLVGIGTRILIFPDKLAFDTASRKVSALSAVWSGKNTSVEFAPCDAEGKRCV